MDNLSSFYHRTARHREKWHSYVVDPSDMIIDKRKPIDKQKKIL